MMISGLLKKIFGSRNDRLIKQYTQTVRRINALEAGIAQLSDEALRAKTDEFKKRYANGEGETLEDLLPEAFAVVREASQRVLGMRHFDVQLIGGMVLHFGKIAEMRTGEGKTLVATLPAYLNAISGKGVHIITVNDYLASRDAAWMGRLHRFLGLSVGVNLSQMEHAAKQEAYASDITYGTNNEFGFDYLRDNMVYNPNERVQRGLNYAIVDEVDSILIDEARTPLIISGQAEDRTDLYVRIDKVVPLLTRAPEEKAPGDYWVDEKGHQVHFSEEGHEHAEQILVNMGLLTDGRSLYEAANIALMHHLNAALRAHTLFLKDQQYVVEDGEVIIIDEHNGRKMTGRRWSDGLHQAVEAKEGVPIQNENQTMASITFQNYFRMYKKLAGMTGTADTEAYEFHQIYGLETVVIPTHRPMVRQDFNDQVFKTADEKHKAIIADVKECHGRGQPVLLGTTSIESSELISRLLEREKLPHQLLNAKQHAREADIVAQAGRPGVITVATNMAGRGTDIVLGGNIEKSVDAVKADETLSDLDKDKKIADLRAEWQTLHEQVLAAGGLRIIASERHESRRIDNQLRGRAGRQGDAGSSRFYLSLDDSLLRIFAGERLRGIMERLKMPEGEAIEHPLVTRSLESAQRKVEGRNFDIRKQLLEYDDVANDQRKVIYAQRNELLESTDISETVTAMRHGVLADLFRRFVPEDSVEEQWDIPALERALASEFLLDAPVGQWITQDTALTDVEILERLIRLADDLYAAKVALVGAEVFHQFERNVMLQSLDVHWREHLGGLDHLRQGIGLRGYAQKNPKQEYKRESFELFEALLDLV
ncbi:protein translocase subunit SecA [Betaproteobacteria bacterium]|nr:protein translocase subunit SecA [Betaproteobacteria bacterium]GHT89657.1 protein translocase subunit SecA [Betaproteobacteria bacterium]